MSAIFLSHSSADDGVAADVSARLQRSGHRSLFLDFDPEHGIPAGRDWERELYAQLRACRACVVLCSERSMRSPWCFAEVTHARALGKAVFPLKVAPCEIHPLLQRTQVIDLTAQPDDGFDRLLRGLRAAGLDPADVFDWDASRPPYPGLLALEEADAAVFFGRTDEIRAVLDVLNRHRRFGGAAFVLLLGASGSGKSSLLRAGVLPRLRKDPGHWIVVPPFRPQHHPFDGLASSLTAAFERHGRARDWRTLREHVTGARSAEGMADLARELRLDAGCPEATVLLSVDQLEEAFGLADADEALRFLSTLRGATEAPGSPVVIAATLRSDFLGSLQTHAALRDVNQPDEILVNPVPVRCLGEIVEGPAKVAGLELEPGLAQALVQDTQDADALPLLAFALRELWERRGPDGRLTLAAYRDQVGGLAGSVARAADGLLEHVSDPEKEELRRAFLAMVRIDEQGHFARRPIASESLPPRVLPLLDRFVQARLLVSRQDGESRVLEVAHEALLTRWLCLKEWLEEDRAFLAWRKRLDEALDDWVAGKRARDRLLGGALLRESEAQLEQRGERLAPRELEFIRASVAANRRARRRRTGIVATATLALLLLGAFALLKGIQERRAYEQARTQVWLSTAANVADRDPLAASLILTELPRREPVPRALVLARKLENVPLAASVLQGGQSAAFSPDGGRVVTGSDDGTVRVWRADGRGEPVLLAGHEGPVSTAVFSPDGGRVLTASWDGTARVWSADGRGQAVVLAGHGGPVSTAAFSPDGRRVVTASWDGTARVWAADGRGEPVMLEGHQEAVVAAAFSADGRRVVTASQDGTARVWNADGSGQPIVLDGHAGAVVGAGFSPDGRRVLTASWDGTARLWSADGQREPMVLSGHDGLVQSAAFSPDGARVVTASSDGTARVWRTDTGRSLALEGHEGAVVSAAFSPDGRRVVTASDDGTARVWNADGDSEPVVLKGHDGPVLGAAVSPDGRRIATASSDGTTRLWEDPQDPAMLEGHVGPVMSAAFSPDGRRVVTASSDATARVWNADGRGEPVVLGGHAGAVVSAAFSSDGRRVVTAGADGTARVWSGDGRGEPVVLRGHARPLVAAAFSGDGQRVVTASRDGTARVWRADGQGQPVVLEGHEAALESAAFSPDGQGVVTTSQDGTARVWRADGQGEPVVLRGHAGPVRSAAFSPDGQRIVTASTDTTARVWRADGRGEPVVLKGHEEALEHADFSPDGHRVATASQDGTARVWSSDGHGEVTVLRGHKGPVRSVDFRSDGRRVVTASTDGTARVWSLDDAGREPLVLEDHAKALWRAVFSPDGRRVVTASLDRTARVWSVDSKDVFDGLARRTTACLSVRERQLYLGERGEEATAHHEACARRHGRAPGAR